MVALLMAEVKGLIVQGKFSILTGKVIGLQGMMWLDVENEADKAIVNFRIWRVPSWKF